MRNRALAFGVFATVCVVATVVAAVTAVSGSRSDRKASEQAVAEARPRADQILTGTTPFAVFRSVDKAHTESYGRLSVASVEDGKPGPMVPAGPSCSRVAFGAGKGICLDLLGTQMSVRLLDDRMQQVSDFELAGIPSRARVSPDGRWGGVTAFVVGHAYTAPGEFSTVATVIDMQAGKPVADLEKDFTVTNAGKVVNAQDRNYWGLTFAPDGDTFYATLATGASTWLIRGSIAKRTAQTIYENVECPSLSPDGTRIGYKKALARNPTKWAFTVLDLTTQKETPLSESRSIDDQLAWLDNERLLYSDGTQTFVVNADGSGSPQRWLPNSDSPTVQETAAAAP
jgi:hypothetical protein